MEAPDGVKMIQKGIIKYYFKPQKHKVQIPWFNFCLAQKLSEKPIPTDGASALLNHKTPSCL